MMAKEPLTPEEKLLQVIDNPELAKQPPLVRLKGKVAKLAAVPSWLRRWQEGRRGAKPLMTLRTANRALAGLCVLVTIGWFADFLNVRNRFLLLLEGLEQRQRAAYAAPPERPLPAPRLTETLEEVRRRNIFTLLPTAPETAAPAQPKLDAAAELKLVGVIWAATPQAMIEQVAEERTSLVGTGDTIGPWKIKQILRDRVMVGHKDSDQEWELR